MFLSELLRFLPLLHVVAHKHEVKTAKEKPTKVGKWPRCIFPGMKMDQRFYFFPLKKSKEHYLYPFSLRKPRTSDNCFCIENTAYV